MGNGDGLGIGDGKGGGALKGEDGNVGGKRNQQGCCGQGGTGGSGQAYTTRPVITYKEKAQYTEEAPKNGVMGVVVLSAVFGEDGEIYDIRPVRQLPDGLTEEAIRALRKIRFRPATKNGTPVSVRMNIEFSFTIF
ncbi:MAG TPA: energy transducer TonB [Blastocatellia bacterium]|nr:energy transducer TonB [Blastocatellia bacterium]